MARFMEIKPVNPKLRQDQTAKEFGCSGSNLQRYRCDINMLSSYRIPPNIHLRRQNFSKTKLDDNPHREQDPKRPQRTSNDPKTHQKNEVVNHTTNKKIKLKGGSMHQTAENTVECLDEILHNIHL